jgi:CubicO group peptidase (beta-lactamase class C family)
MKAMTWLPMRAVCLGAVLLLSCQSTPKTAAPASIEKGDWEAVRQRLSNVIEAEMKASKVVGLGIALVDDREVVWSRGFGFADRETGAAATGDTLFRIGSVSKLFIATAVMQLAEMGLVDIDRPVSDYLPGFTVRSRFPGAAPITVRNLLTHHSGLPDIERGADRDPSTGMLLLPECAEDSLSQPPNTLFSYSNLGYRLLGCLIESVSGRTFSEYIDESILKPLAMAGSSFDAGDSPLLSMGYVNGAAVKPPAMYDPAGSLCSSVTDLARFVEMIFADGTTGSSRIVSAETLRSMLTPQNDGIPLDMDTRIGLGWHLYDLTGLLPAGVVAAGHTGYDTIFTSFLMILPEEKLGVVVLVNSDEAGSAAASICYRAISLMYEASTGIHTDPPVQPAEDVTSEIRLTDGELARLTGFYETSGNDPFIEVRLEAGRLVSVIEGRKVWIVPLAGGGFTVRWLLFGFVPVRLAEMERSIFSFEDVSGRLILVEHRGPYKRLAGTKIERWPIPPAWAQRLGKWECMDTGNGMVYNRSITLREQSGFLIIDVDTFAEAVQGNLPWGAVLQPLSDDEAIVPGIQHARSAGETLRAVMRGGREMLRFAGAWYGKRGGA